MFQIQNHTKLQAHQKPVAINISRWSKLCQHVELLSLRRQHFCVKFYLLVQTKRIILFLRRHISQSIVTDMAMTRSNSNKEAKKTNLLPDLWVTHYQITRTGRPVYSVYNHLLIFLCFNWFITNLCPHVMFSVAFTYPVMASIASGHCFCAFQAETYMIFI